MRQEDKKNYVFYQETEKKGNVRSGVDNMRKITKILLNILGFILTAAVSFIVIIATLTFIVAWSAIG